MYMYSIRKLFWAEIYVGKGCMQCKANFEDYDSPCPHVDHCGQKEFRHIVTEFENQLDEKDFAKFHRKHAVYQILCEECHYKKPKNGNLHGFVWHYIDCARPGR